MTKMQRGVAALLLVLLAAGAAAFSPRPARASDAGPAAGTDLPLAAAALLDLANRDRATAGVPPLAMRSDIAAIALDHSRAMAARGEIWHSDAYFTDATRSALGARTLGENVAYNFSPEATHAALMASDRHRSNLLDARFNAAGFAVVTDGKGGLYVTQGFAQVSMTASAPAAAQAPVQPKPAPAAAPPAPRRPAPPAATPVTTAPPPPPATVPPTTQPVTTEAPVTTAAEPPRRLATIAAASKRKQAEPSPLPVVAGVTLALGGLGAGAGYWRRWRRR